MVTVSAAEAVGKSLAAFRLFLLLDRRQLDRFGDDLESVRKSFWAPVLMAPIVLWRVSVGDPDMAPAYGWLGQSVADLSMLAINIVYWPLAMVTVSHMLQKPERFARYVAAYNWVSVPVTAIWLVLALAFGTEAATLGGPALLLLFWALLFRIVLARRVFDAPLGVGIALAAADFMLGQIVLGLRASVIFG